MVIHPYICIDHALGRIEYASLTEQSQMEILVDQVKQREFFTDERGNYEDIAEWEGVEMNDDGTVNTIFWCDLLGGGNIRLDFLPANTSLVDISMNALSGTISTSLLPRTLTMFTVFANQLSGSIILGNLPSVTEFDVNFNKLSGSLDIHNLPASIVYFGAKGNEFSGTVDMSHLPDRLNILTLAENKISGTIDLSHIPKSLHELDVSDNAIKQNLLTIGILPNSLYRISLQGNPIQGIEFQEPEIGFDPRVRLGR